MGLGKPVFTINSSGTVSPYASKREDNVVDIAAETGGETGGETGVVNAKGHVVASGTALGTDTCKPTIYKHAHSNKITYKRYLPREREKEI